MSAHPQSTQSMEVDKCLDQKPDACACIFNEWLNHYGINKEYHMTTFIYPISTEGSVTLRQNIFCQKKTT